jgi:ABC-type transport system involved in cytochrome c biogenesis permease subunit
VKNKISFLLVSLFLSLTVQAQPASTFFCNDELGKMPIQQNGRVKPLYVHANETLKYLTEKRSVGEFSSTTAYCLLSLKAASIPTPFKISALVPNPEIAKQLGLDESAHEIDYDILANQAETLRNDYRRMKEDDHNKKPMGKLVSQANLYISVTTGQDWTFPEVSADRIDWVPFTSFLQESRIEAAAKISNSPFEVVFATAKKQYEEKAGTTHLLEYHYARAHLAWVSLAITLLALAALTLWRRFTPAIALAGLTVLLQTIMIIVRIMISGRAPITNMYETVMFSGYGSLLLGLIIGHFRKEKTFVYVGLAYNAMTLMMLNFATGMLSDAINPLVPVLRDNFWLSTHVTTIILSYGALALSWVLANTVLLKRRFSVLAAGDERYYADLIYSCLKYGTVMLAAGIILGGVWADYSWGRFWGWDPKETWSLIVLCIYMSILHGRYTNWIPAKRFVMLVAGAFMSVMMAWFGVNYILASGLHSYGFSEGGAIFLGSFFFIQTLFLVITAKDKPNGSESDPHDSPRPA